MYDLLIVQIEKDLSAATTAGVLGLALGSLASIDDQAQRPKIAPRLFHHFCCHGQRQL